MKRTELLKKLAYAKPCLGSQEFVAVLTHFCFDKKTVIAFNGVQAMVVPFETGLSCAVPGDLFYKLVNSYTSEEVKISQRSTDILIEAGSSSMKLATMAEETFIFKVPDFSAALSVDISDEFFQAIRMCALSMNTDPSKQSQLGMTLDSTAERSILYSTDECRISRYTFTKQLSATSFKVLLPRTFCELIMSLGKEFTSGKLSIAEDALQLSIGDMTLITKFIKDMSFLDFEQVISSLVTQNSEIAKQEIPLELHMSLERALILLSSEINPIISISTKGNTLTMNAKNSYGDIVDSVGFTEQLGENSFRMDGNFLKQGLAAIDKMQFLLAAQLETPQIVLTGEKGNFFHVISSQTGE